MPTSARREADAADSSGGKGEEGGQQSDNNASHQSGGTVDKRHKAHCTAKNLDAFQSHPKQQQRPESDHEACAMLDLSAIW